MPWNRAISSIISIILLLQIMLILNPEVEAASGSFGGGSGTISDPYLIEDVWDLQNMSIDSHYALKNNISASITATWNSGEGFIPIGNDSSRFNGTLDGRNYTIFDLFINRPLEECVGLFGYIKANGMVRNLKMIDSNVTGNKHVGSIAGIQNNVEINNSYVEGRVSGRENVGGISGYDAGLITNCSFIGNVSASFQIVGGITGYLRNGKIINSSSYGKIEGGNYTGGLTGIKFKDSPIINCSSSGMVIGNQRTGGLVGVLNGGVVNRSYSTANVRGFGDYTGGLTGYNSNIGLINNSFSTGDVSGKNFTGGLVGFNSAGITRSWASGNISGLNEVGGLIGRNGYRVITDCHASGNVNGSGEQIGGFVGMNHNRVSIFNSYATGNITGDGDEVGGFAGQNNQYSKIIRCYSTGNVIGDGSNYGGFAGLNDGSEIIECFSKGDLNGSCNVVGGLIGLNDYYASVSNSYAHGDLLGTGWASGGLIGKSYRSSTVTNCYSVGLVNSSSTSSGGLIGTHTSGISNCYWDTDTSGKTTSYGGRGKNTTEMKTEATYSNWNFTGKWSMIHHNTYPELSWEGGGHPFADAGPDMTVDEGAIVTFNGTGSHDDIGISNYTWIFDNVVLSGVQPTYLFNDPGRFVVTLIVNNTLGNRDGDIVIIKVNDKTPPVADAGPNRTVNEDTIITLDGSNSTDNLAIVSWIWTFTYNNNPINLYGESPNFNFTIPGIYIITLKVSDKANYWDIDTTTIIVRDITIPKAVTYSERTVNEDTIVTLDGTWSTDNVGIVNWTWTFIYNSTVVNLYGETQNFIFEIPGIYEIILNVSDSAGNWDNMTQVLTVMDITPPVAIAGQDLTVNEGTIVSLDGSSSTDNKNIVNWTWAFTYNGSVVRLYGKDQSYLFYYPGIYIVTLTVIDGNGNKGEDTIEITILDITPPKAIAGPDTSIDEDSVYTFDGAQCSDNVDVVNWTWTFVYNGTKIVIFGITADFLFEIPGTYTIDLDISDDKGLQDIDSLTLTVLDITQPTAITGPHITMDEDSTATMDGMESYDNVGIVEYTWSFVDGEPMVLIGVQVEYLFSEPGVYHAVLNVSDLAGHWDTDIMVITVNDITSPVAVVGSDVQIEEGEEIIMDGSSSLDNVHIENYTWTFYDGNPVKLFGAGPNYRFDNPGVYVITLNVTDAAGYYCETEMIVTVLDITDPIVSIDPQPAYEDSIYSFNGLGCSDNVGVVNWTWTIVGDSENIELYGVQAIHIFSDPGSYSITLLVLDEGGNGATKSFDLIVEEITSSGDDPFPEAIEEDSAYTFDCYQSNHDYLISNWTWTFNLGDEKVELFGPLPEYTFLEPGIYAIRLMVIDISGNKAVGDLVLKVEDITRPIVDAGANITVTEGKVVKLEATGSDNVGIVNWTWTFNDGKGEVTLFGNSVNYAFPKAGTYNVKLSVEDESGNSKEDSMVVVVDKKDEGSSVMGVLLAILIIVLLLIGLAVFFFIRRIKASSKDNIPSEDGNETNPEVSPSLPNINVPNLGVGPSFNTLNPIPHPPANSLGPGQNPTLQRMNAGVIPPARRLETGQLQNNMEYQSPNKDY